jgi:hypothetical protein
MKRVALWLCLIPALQAGAFRFRASSPASLELTEDGKPVYVYNHGMLLKEGVAEALRRSTYLHPVYAPDGTVLTDDFPKDHPHHRGVCWTWPVVKVDGETHDLWAVLGIRQKFVRWLARDAKPEMARLGVENGWYVGERKVLKETVEIVARPAEGNRRTLEFRLTFEALERPIELRGRPEKGYGGFGFRFAPREQTVIRTEAGLESKDTDLVTHPWAELEASFKGRRAGARIEVDPSNPNLPNAWCLRHYGYLGVNFPGLGTYTLAPGKVLVLKYRVTVFSR